MFRSRPFIKAAAVLVLLLIVAAGGYYFYFDREHGSVPAPDLRNVKTLAGLDREFSEPFGIAVRDGVIYVSDGNAGKIFAIAGDSSVSLYAEGLHTPSAIAFDIAGDLIVADTGANTIKKIASDKSISVLAGIENSRGFSDGPAGSALFSGPIGLAIDTAGRIYVSDTYNDRIRVIENNSVRTLAGGERGFADGTGASARFDTPLGIAVWHDQVLVADSQNQRIRSIDPDGTTRTFAGSENRFSDGFPLEAAFVEPTAIAVNSAGSIFIADGDSIRVIGRRSFPLVETLSDNRRGYRDGASLLAQFNRPSGIAADDSGTIFIADSDNGAVRAFSSDLGAAASPEQIKAHRYSAAEFRDLQPARWPYDPPDAVRDVAGTLGEVRGAITGGSDSVWFHNGLDIAGSYGETARFVRTEKVLEPSAAENFETSRELLRMPTLGYIHIRLGRDKDKVPFADPRFIFESDPAGKLIDVRIPRGTAFNAGEPLGTLNSQNHVHLIAGRPGSEMNAIDALRLPGLTDSITPVIEDVSLYDHSWSPFETQNSGSRIKLSGNVRIIVKAFDRVDGNPERRKLGIYRLGYQLFAANNPLGDVQWTIEFDRMPSNEAVGYVYAKGSRSGATGGTTFNYIVSNRVNGDGFSENFLDTSALQPGDYSLRVFAADFFGNTAIKDINFEVQK